MKRKKDVFPDRVDIRDWFYQSTLAPLPDTLVNCERVPLVLDQGEEGACTGFALAANINFLLSQKNLSLPGNHRVEVSPRMLYEMARKYDEWPGEKYEGSSARGTMKGWLAHGVCTRKTWTDKMTGSKNLTLEIADKSRHVPGGAYYRVVHKQVRDMHCALSETGILFATLMVHEGWDDPGPTTVEVKYKSGSAQKTMRLPVIQRKNRAPDGHAVAIVGYTPDGFIIQNSWGRTWGRRGFALLPYEDWIIHSSDCWVAQLGVPINLDMWSEGKAADTTAGMQRASAVIPLSEIRPYVIDIGNNGKLSQSGEYWTNEEDISRMFESINEKTQSWDKRRIMLYLHGGLNSEKEVARRVISFRDVLLENNIYPVHIMWETGVWESLKSNVFDMFTKEDERAGASWLEKLRDGAIELKDRTFELTTSKFGTMMWDEMKENAGLASERADGGMKILCDKAKEIFQSMAAAEKNKWELHIVGHSAGSIFAAYAMERLLTTGLGLKSIQFMAPAITVELFKNKILSLVNTDGCPLPQLFVLSDEGEKKDSVGPYGKSLLYLVSNSFESRRETPILGMEKFINGDAELKKQYRKTNDKGWPYLVIADPSIKKETGKPDVSCSESHGGFDNDAITLNAVLYRILNRKPKRPFSSRDLSY